MADTAYRQEYPRPQFRRNTWINLNGEWDFTIDQALTGEERDFQNAKQFDRKIQVPFCPESRLSGIAHTDFMRGVWYTRTFTLPAEWQQAGRRSFVHIGACDYRTKVFINGQPVGRHTGGYSSFCFEITHALTDGENRITVFAEDDTRSGAIPSGKQSPEYSSYGCFYTRTTGIWQTVWLENTPAAYIKSVKMTPCISECALKIEATFDGAEGLSFSAKATFHGKAVGEKTLRVDWNHLELQLPLQELQLWEPQTPNLYDITFTLGEDTVQSYFGMREIAFRDYKTYLNGKPLFQRLILDQGFYPDGIYTAPNEQELIQDIERSKAMGFNGARLHQKVFEPLFLYHCDRLGYLVWGEYPNWGLNVSREAAYKGCLPEWLEVLERDYNHPAIIGWCPLNETQLDIDPELAAMLFRMTKLYDPTRLFIDNSGWCHVAGTYDMMDVHDYCGDPATFRNKYLPLAEGGEAEYLSDNTPHSQVMKKSGDICFVSEFGGIPWDPKASNGKDSWGYGSTPEDTQAFLARYKGLVDALLDNPHICAFCYTQLTDVEQETNGLYTYDRQAKFDTEILRSITSRKAAIEK